MADIKLTCAETPLNWPKNVNLDELPINKTSGLKLYSPQPGPGQILTRRQGSGVGDGVNIVESNSVGADYRGQRYTLDEVIFHAQAIHIFPGVIGENHSELHIHMYTNSSPRRYLTIVVPVSHLVEGPGQDYFATCAARPDPSKVRPPLSSVLVSGSKILQYRGPDIRGRTAATPTPASCNSNDEREFLLILGAAHIRATDLERIPREGSLSTDKRDMPADMIPYDKRRTVSRDRLIRIASVASPGLLGSSSSPASSVSSAATVNELECKPVKVVNGRDVIDENGKAVDVYTLLGISGEVVPEGTDTATLMTAGRFGTMFIGVVMGLLFADWLFGGLWAWFFNGSRVEIWEPIKIWIFLSIAIGAGVGAAVNGSPK
jgi:hypothetical protein